MGEPNSTLTPVLFPIQNHVMRPRVYQGVEKTLIALFYAGSAASQKIWIPHYGPRSLGEVVTRILRTP